MKLHPEWKQAVQDAVGRFSYGDLIPMDWLMDAFGVEPASESMDALTYQKNQFRFLAALEAFKSALLDDHKMALQNVRGSGYRIVQPGEQTAWAEEEGIEEIRRGIRRMAGRLSNVKRAALTDAEQRENLDAIARLSMLKGMVRDYPRLSAPEEAEDEA